MIYTSGARISILRIVSFIQFGLVLLAADTVKPKALPVPVRTEWLGDDGIWSPVSIRVGTPPQWVNVFVSTASEETWVVGPGGGCASNKECETKRGGIFRSNLSSTWTEVGRLALGLNQKLGFGGNGEYGFDSIALSDQISVPSQTVAVINTTEYWLGFMGLGITPTNFSAATNGTSTDRKTFLSSLVETSRLIPSHSYGYTAGAYYRLKHVPSSLTLGGYDANRFNLHNVSFDLDPNLDPVVSLNGITVTADPLPSSTKSTGWPSNSQILLGPADTALYTIDSSTPYLWLPETVCSRFEKALGLTYDQNVRLYTFSNDSTQPETLVNWNLTFNFVIADLPGSSKSISLTLPYAAFDLQLTYPFPGLNKVPSSPATKYFPLRKADNDTQYTIGRAFLQETYLMVDYGRNNFSLYQAKFATDASTNTRIVDILPPDKNTLPGGSGASSSRGFSKGAIIGIAIGGFAIIAIIAGFLIYCIRVRRREIPVEGKGKPDARPDNSIVKRLRGWLLGTPKADRPMEIDGTPQFRYEADGDGQILELPESDPTELPGSEVEESPYQAEQRKIRMMKAINPVDHNTMKPVELQHRPSTEGFYGPKFAVELDSGPESSPPFLTPHSPSQIGRHNTERTRVSSRSRTSRGSSNLSSPMLISPLTPHHPSLPNRPHNTRRDQSWMLHSDESDFSDQDTTYETQRAETPRPHGGDRLPDSTHSPQPSPRRFSWERRS